MAIAQEASTPAVASATGTAAATTAAFSPPAGVLLVAISCGGFINTGTWAGTLTISDSASGAWTQGVQLKAASTGNSFGGVAQVHYQYLASAQTNMTVTATPGGTYGGGTVLFVLVLTGAAANQANAATATFNKTAAGTSWQISITPKYASSLIVGVTHDSASASIPTASTNETALGSANSSGDQNSGLCWKASAVTPAAPANITFTSTGLSADGGPLACLEILPAPLVRTNINQAVNRAATW